jgi:glutathione S-transferase
LHDIVITLYELRWLHDCEKVRLALDYMGLRWRSVGIDAFGRRELCRLPLPAPTVPALHDESTNRWVLDATPILEYLDATYPNRPALFPGDSGTRAAITARLNEFDTHLAPAARRLGCTQLIEECPEHLSELFLARRARALLEYWPFKRHAGKLVGLLLKRSHALARTELPAVLSQLERYLLTLAQQLAGRPYVVGCKLSAADLALAAQLRPLTIVPYFAEHPELQTLFERHHRVLLEYSPEGELPYQRAIAAARRGVMH